MVQNLFWDHSDADVRLTPNCEAARYKVELMSAVCRRIEELVKAGGGTLVFMIIPAAADVMDDYDRDVVSTDDFPGYRRTNLVAALEAAVGDTQAPHLSLFEPFREDGGDLYHRGGDTHWNAEGQELAAEDMVRFLRESSILE